MGGTRGPWPLFSWKRDSDPAGTRSESKSPDGLCNHGDRMRTTIWALQLPDMIDRQKLGKGRHGGPLGQLDSECRDQHNTEPGDSAFLPQGLAHNPL